MTVAASAPRKTKTNFNCFNEEQPQLQTRGKGSATRPYQSDFRPYCLDYSLFLEPANFLSTD
jgi:hypothetical protein